MLRNRLMLYVSNLILSRLVDKLRPMSLPEEFGFSSFYIRLEQWFHALYSRSSIICPFLLWRYVCINFTKLNSFTKLFFFFMVML